MEKRLYQRIRVKLISNFILLDKEPGLREFCAVIDDLSENGIKISIAQSEYSDIIQNIDITDRIAFQAIDEYKIYNDIRTAVISGEANVIRIDRDGDNIVIGCKIYKSSYEFEEYVRDKKVASFIRSNCTFR